MNWEALSAIANVLGAAAVVLSLIYVAVQVRQSTKQARLAAQRSAVNELGRALQSLARNQQLAEIYVRGMQDYSQLSVVERARFSSFMAHLFKLFEELFLLYREGSLDPQQWQGFERALTDIIAYPGVQSWWETRSHWMTPDWREMMGVKIAAAAPTAIYRERPHDTAQPEVHPPSRRSQ